MIRKKASKRAKGQKTGTKKSGSKKSTSRAKKEMNPAEVRKDIAKIVGAGAVKMTEAVMEEAMKGQLAPTKYLLEVAGVYPAATDESVSTSEEDSLAKTLLERLNLPTEPIKLDDDDEPATVVIPGKREVVKDSGEVAASEEKV